MWILIAWAAWWALSFITPIKLKLAWLIPKRFAGFAFAPFIGYSKIEYVQAEWFLKHEMEHIKQQRVLSPLLFFIIYYIEYIWNLAQGMNSFDAYYSIGFEVMARRAEKE